MSIIQVSLVYNVGMIKKLVSIIVVVALLYLGYLRFFAPQTKGSIHYHAGFIVYVDGMKQDFSAAKYMNFTPCSEHTQKQTSAQEQIEKAHLHDSVGDVVHVHRSGAVWSDLFKNIGYPIPSGKPIVGYMGGSKIDNPLSTPIKADDSLILVIGNPEGVDTKQSVSLDHIKEIESKSELCGTT